MTQRIQRTLPLNCDRHNATGEFTYEEDDTSADHRNFEVIEISGPFKLVGNKPVCMECADA